MSMDTIQLTIIAVVVALILLTISYYLYQEAKFKKMVENNFNQATHDVIVDENKTFTLDGVDTNKPVPQDNPILQKDVALAENTLDDDPLFDMQEAVPIVTKPVADETPAVPIQDLFATKAPEVEEEVVVHPEHSVEAFFADIHKVGFPFADQINYELDFVVDVGFEEIRKIKALPEISQFTDKPFKIYVLDKNNQWLLFNRGEKYAARALKFVVQLVDNEGLISQAQLSNIYNEWHKFVMQNEAHIYRSDYEASISKIQHQIKHLEKIELNLSLFIITQESYSYSDLIRFFGGLGLIDSNGVLQLAEGNQIVFKISADNGSAFKPANSYNLLQVTANLHRQKDPHYAIEKIFDCAEKVMQNFEARLLTSNKNILGQKDYDAITQHVKKYADNAKQNGIELGGELISRVF
jgi:hypothetical protein